MQTSTMQDQNQEQEQQQPKQNKDAQFIGNNLVQILLSGILALFFNLLFHEYLDFGMCTIIALLVVSVIKPFEKKQE